MPDALSAEDQERIDRIRQDLDYYRKANRQASNVGSQPPTVYASKYVDDLKFLLDIAQPEAAPAEPEPPSELETALAHDAAGRVERKSKR